MNIKMEKKIWNVIMKLCRCNECELDIIYFSSNDSHSMFPSFCDVELVVALFMGPPNRDYEHTYFCQMLVT